MKCTNIKENELLNLIGNLCLIIYEISTCLLLVFNARGLLSKYSIKIALIYYIIGDIRRKLKILAQLKVDEIKEKYLNLMIR